MIFVLLVGCEQGHPEKLLIRTWEASGFIPSHEMARLSKDPLPDGASMEMTYAGIQTYHLGNKYDGEATITLRMRNDDQEIALRFHMKDAGTWKLHGDTLVETSEDSVVTPLDDRTKTLISNMPELKASFTPVKGESTSSIIKHMSASTVELELQNPKGLNITLQKI